MRLLRVNQNKSASDTAACPTGDACDASLRNIPNRVQLIFLRDIGHDEC